jgi:hypothetical protein
VTRLRITPSNPVGEGVPGSPGRGGSGTPGLAVVQAPIVVVPFGATVTGAMGSENGEPLGSVPVTEPVTVAVLDPPVITNVPPTPEAQVPGVIVSRPGVAVAEAVRFSPTLESAGVC